MAAPHKDGFTSTALVASEQRERESVPGLSYRSDYLHMLWLATRIEHECYSGGGLTVRDCTGEDGERGEAR